MTLTAVPAEGVLRRARSMLNEARIGQRALADARSSDEYPTSGIRIVAVFGRSVTFVLQNLRSICGDHFDAWYEPRRADMAADPLMRYFVELRNEVLKEGGPLGLVFGVGAPFVGDPPADLDSEMSWYLSRDTPTVHAGKEIRGQHVAHLSALYLDTLEQLIDDAESMVVAFAGPSAEE